MIEFLKRRWWIVAAVLIVGFFIWRRRCKIKAANIAAGEKTGTPVPSVKLSGGGYSIQGLKGHTEKGDPYKTGTVGGTGRMRPVI